MSAMRTLAGELNGTNRPIVTYRDCPAEESSARAAVNLRQRGISNVHALLGGSDRWVSSGQAVEK